MKTILRYLRILEPLPKTITIIIPKQEFNHGKYMGWGQMCYLKEALHNIGYIAHISGYGVTRIENRTYTPSKDTPFDAGVAQDKLPHSDLTIVLNLI